MVAADRHVVLLNGKSGGRLTDLPKIASAAGK
jgi:hypothetical protein